LPDADLELFAQSGASEAFHQLAAGSIRQLSWAFCVYYCHLEANVEIVAEMAVYNPFDFSRGTGGILSFQL
jgi:hypothetical protein